MDDGFVVIGVSPKRDPTGSKLRTFLQSQLAAERARALRELLVYAMAAASLPLGFLVARPANAGASFRSLVLAGWLTSTIALLFTGVREWTYRRRCAALQQDLAPPP